MKNRFSNRLSLTMALLMEQIPDKTSITLYTILSSNPKYKSRFLSPRSISTNKTLLPSMANNAPILAANMVFPVPPFPDAIRIVFPIKIVPL